MTGGWTARPSDDSLGGHGVHKLVYELALKPADTDAQTTFDCFYEFESG